MTIDEKKKDIEIKLSEIFVEKYDFFKDTINKINELFKKYDIDFQYDYNSFCKEYINKCKNVIDENPDIDLTSNKYFLIYGIISASMISDKKNLNNKNE
jgi:phosphoenolpyruvate carboxylase